MTIAATLASAAARNGSSARAEKDTSAAGNAFADMIPIDKTILGEPIKSSKSEVRRIAALTLLVEQSRSTHATNYVAETSKASAQDESPPTSHLSSAGISFSEQPNPGYFTLLEAQLTDRKT